MSELRALVREILLEELGDDHRKTAIRTVDEQVSIQNDGDLRKFALRVLELGKDCDLGAEIHAGRINFRLSGAGVETRRNTVAPECVHDPAIVRFEKGVITEKEIARLADSVTGISIEKAVCLTPLAKDEIRRRGLKIERKEP